MISDKQAAQIREMFWMSEKMREQECRRRVRGGQLYTRAGAMDSLAGSDRDGGCMYKSNGHAKGFNDGWLGVCACPFGVRVRVRVRMRE